jgi:probable F420-dependent oxidoreductase
MAALKPFRFGVAAGGKTWTRAKWIATARLAEDLGYDTFLVADHLWGDIAPVPTLMAIADATTSLRVGGHVFCNDFRVPVLLAREVATLDIFSQGRIQLGLGCGYHFDDYQQSGIPFDEPRVRVDRFKEALYIIKHYFTDEVVNFSGTYYHVKDLKGSITHIQKPHPPLFIGGDGKRMFTIAGREADIVGISAGTSEATRQKLGWLREAAGARFDLLELATVVFVARITERRNEVAQEIASHFPIPQLADRIILTPESALDNLCVLIGSVEQIVETLLERRERFGISYIQVDETSLETLAPVVARLAGK